MDTIDTSGKAFIEFWKWAADKGEMNSNTAGSIQAACSQVLKAIDQWETVDIRTLNIDDTCRRFQNKRSKDFKPASLTTYISRFNTGISMFLQYSQDPSSWKPSVKTRTTTTKERKTELTKNTAKPDSVANENAHFDLKKQDPQTVLLSSSTTTPPLIEYPFPLREGRLAFFKLPADLKSTEVRRLVAYLNTLAMDSEIS